ncbi:MAG: hypothetical protein EAZ20_00770 [Bacteroidetes bacterium]|nr:MAG: hypothetical protein EAZ20_00770 [Bacteroidota bacterium]
MKKITLILIAVLFLNINAAFAQKKAKITEQFLKSMEGNWEGKLTYTDYQDDSTQVTMNVWLQSNIENKKLIKQFFYKEPDGNTKQKSKSQDTTFITNKGKNLVESGYKLPFKIKEYTTKEIKESSSTTVDGVKTKNISSASSEQSVIMETIADDNDKKSTIRLTITLKPNSMVIKKEVKYDGTNKFFTRHTFTYTK